MSADPLDNLPLFQGFTDEQRAQVKPLFLPCDFYAGSAIFEQGAPAEYLYAVVLGEVVVNFKPDDGPPITVARVQPGGMVGWSATLGSRRYTSGAICETYTQLLRISGSDLRRLCERHPDTGVLLLDRLAAVIAERLDSTHDLVVSLLKMGLHHPTQNAGG
jgi:CRP-like cAMP-binding protein